MRNSILVLHRWAALILGAIIFVVSVSGALLVFAGPIDRAANPALFRAAIPASGPVRLPLDSVLAAARSRGIVDGVRFPDAEGRAVIARLAGGTDVFLNPYTGAVLGVRTAVQRTASVVGVIQRLHENLLGKTIGGQVVLWTTAVSFLLVLGGLYLWWQDKIWRTRTGSSWKRMNYDLHHLLGFWMALVLLCMTLTGVTMNYPLLARSIARLDGTAPPEPRRSAPPAPGTVTISLDSAVRVGHAALPGTELRSVTIPADTLWPLSLSLRYPEDHLPGGRSRVMVDRWTGTVVQVRSSRTTGLATRIAGLQRPLHSGELYGATTQAIWFLGAMILAAQVVSGGLMWWHGRPARLAEKARRSKAAAA